ncbi:MAG: efflux RND transporter periplasmic adaptor subunit [Tannerella sp.]|jgi:multidrug resistance efflux pump|nr:efflux RND transporter periplasmic adaptor subunit [Tannerella sp.]
MKSDIFILPVFIMLFSCTSGEKGAVMTYTVERGDFENTLTIDGYVEPLRSTTANCPPYIEGTVGFLVEDGTYVKEGEVVCIVEVAELQTRYDQLKADYEIAQVDLTKAQADLALRYTLLEAEVKTNEAETQIARLDSLQLKYAPPNQVKIKELELQQVTIQKNRFEKKLKALDVIRESEIKMQELKVRQLANRLQTAKDQLEALSIKAPKDGLAVRVTNWVTGKKLQVGDRVWHLMPLVNLPEFAGMKVIIQAPEADYRYINVGDSVTYTFDAMPDNGAYGKIQKKSPVGQERLPFLVVGDNNSKPSKVKFFDIEASIDSAQTMPDPGYTASCRILLKLLKDTLAVPQVAIFDEDSIRVVYVKRGRKFDMQQVQIGLSSPKEAVITSGLQGGEEISLMKPPSSSLRKRLLLLPADSTRNTPADSLSNEIS